MTISLSQDDAPRRADPWTFRFLLRWVIMGALACSKREQVPAATEPLPEATPHERVLSVLQAIAPSDVTVRQS
ncbi:MAG TPA: hypothetical protein VHO06_09460, partial [Polyangia bacterium]|nr:hypothetical protein [Polyangia bacterium]